MKGSKDVLSSIIKTTQMGQIGIRSVLNAPLRATLKDTLRSQLQEYDAIERYLMDLKEENALLDHNYRSNYDLEQIRTTALALGMVPATEANTIVVKVTMPEPEVEPTQWDDFIWFMKGLFA